MKRDFYESKQINPTGHISMTLFKGTYENGKINGEILDTYEDHNVIINKASVFMAGRMAPNNTPRVISEPTYDELGNISSSTSIDSFESYPLPNGFQYLALGNGLLEDDSIKNDIAKKGEYLYNPSVFTPADEQKTLNCLLHETIRKKITSWAFVNGDGTISDTETNILKLTTLFDEHDLSSEEGGTLYNLTDEKGEPISDELKHDRHFIVEMGLFGGNASDAANSGYMFNHRLCAAWNKIEGSSLLINWTITF